MEQPLWMPKRRIEVAYRRSLLRLAEAIIRQMDRVNDLPALTRALGGLVGDETFSRFAEAAAMKMVTGLFSDQGRTWREAARRNSQGRRMYEALKREMDGSVGYRVRAITAENANLIRTLPALIAQDVTDYIAREAGKGRRPEAIEEEIRRMFPSHTKARAKLIARTEVSKAQTSLIQARAEVFGWDWYAWCPVGGGQGDGRTRSSHRKMSDVLVNWRDPPALEDLFPLHRKDGRPYHNALGHYHAGCCPNCRCYPEPVVDLDVLDWPMKIYRNGSIGRVTRKQFEGMM